MLETLAKQYVPELDQNYRYHANRRMLEFDDGTEYTLIEAVIMAKGSPAPETIRAVHEIKRIFCGTLMTEKQEKEFLLFGGKNEKLSCVDAGMEGAGDRKVPEQEGKRKKYNNGGGSDGTEGSRNGPDSVPLLLL